MKIPTTLKHKPVIVAENYDSIDGRGAYHSDAKGLSLGLAQWNDRGKVDISAKVWRHTGEKWSRQSEELPMHRVLDLAILLCRTNLYFRDEAYRHPRYYDPEHPRIDRVGLQGDAMDIEVCTENPMLEEDIRLFYNVLGEDGELLGERFSVLARLLREMCDGEPYGISRLGDEAGAEKLQMPKLHALYGELLATARLELFYCGSASLERVREALAAAFATLPRDGIRDIAPSTPHPARTEVKRVEEAMDVTQGKLGMGFACGSDDYAAALMGNTLFGGSSNSKLFLNVREKLSLCYYASSLYHRQKGLITVSSGIEFQNYQRAYDEIMAQLEAVQKGELEDWELEGARSTLLNNYATVGDSQGKLENFYLGQAATGQHETPADLARAIQDMTAERICRAMSTVKLDTVYFLKGKEGEA